MAVELFPLGTVVKLKGAEKLLMICGYAAMSESNPDVIYDYSGFLYPEGYIHMNEIYQFNDSQIEELHALGYQDRETIAYKNAVGIKLQELRDQKK